MSRTGLNKAFTFLNKVLQKALKDLIKFLKGWIKVLKQALKGLTKQVQDKSGLEACLRGLPLEDMHGHCSTPSHYRIGGDISGGCEKGRARIAFSTVGLACKWYASLGLNHFPGFGAVLLDEIGSLERSVDYRLTSEVMQRLPRQWADAGYKMFIMMCTATISDRVHENLQELEPVTSLFATNAHTYWNGSMLT